MTTSHDAALITYELALLQYRPIVTSEEVLNVGVVAFSPDINQIACNTTDHYSRLRAVYPNLDGLAFRILSRSIRTQCRALMGPGDGKQLRLLDEFRAIDDVLDRLVAPGSAGFGWSSVRYGVCEDLDKRVNEVFEEYVGRFEERHIRERTDSNDLWKSVAEDAIIKPILEQINTPRTLEADNYEHTFRGSWMNGKLQLVDAISLDYAEPADMVKQAVIWTGIVDVLRTGHKFDLTTLVTDRPDGAAGVKHDQATALLSKIPGLRAVIPQSRIQQFRELIEQDLLHGDAGMDGDEPAG